MTNVALHIVDPADMTTRTERLTDTAELIARIRALGDQPGGDRREVVLVVPRKGRQALILRRSVPGGAADELRALMDAETAP